MRARTATLALSLALAACDPPRTAPPARPDATPPPRRVEPAQPADRVVTRTVLSYYHYLRTDPPPPGESVGVQRGRIDLALVVEVHKNPSNEGWITVAALGPNVDIPEDARLRAEGATAQWHPPAGGFNDFRMEPFGGEVRADEPVRVYLASQPERAVTLSPSSAPAPQRLPAEGALPASQRASAGQFDVFVVAVVPVRTRRGGRYLLQVFDMNAQPGGFGQNGVMDHLPTRAEVDRYTAWMRDPQGMARERRPPVPVTPIDRS